MNITEIKTYLKIALAVPLVLGVAACSEKEAESESQASVSSASSAGGWKMNQDESHRLFSVGGFSQPEAVRYDSEQDVYFVANLNGESAGDANGFVSKVSAEGVILDLKFMVGTEEHPFHGGRGMYITGDILWVNDAQGVHAFNKRTGSHLSFTDFSRFEPGFLNDIVAGPDGALYVTDTPKARLYRIYRGEVEIVAEGLTQPNGVTLDPQTNSLVLAPWGGALEFGSWESSAGLGEYGKASGGGNFDGIEFVDGALISASQIDTSLHILRDGKDEVMITTPGRPADIGLDTLRKNVAVPYIALNRVDVWALRN